MRLLVIGAGMMGYAAAYDMARSNGVEAITLADADGKRAKQAVASISRLIKDAKVTAATLDATNARDVRRMMEQHDGALSAIPYFHNFALAKAGVDARCHFADLGGNNAVVRQELSLDKKASKRGVRLAPDCGLSPGMASILGGELIRRAGSRIDALKIYVGGIPQKPKPPFDYQLVFSVEGLINEYAEPARILRKGKLVEVEPLTEVERFIMSGFPTLEAFHTSGGTSTLPETFKGKVSECFEKTLRYPGHVAMIRALYDLGLFSKEKRKIGNTEIAPRELTARLLTEKFSGDAPDVTIMRIEAHRKNTVHSFVVVDRYDPKTKLTSMMRTTAWPASIVLQMIVSGQIDKLGAVLQERDIPAGTFIEEMESRGVNISYAVSR